MSTKKQQTITFKADAALAEAIRAQPNRSQFLRGAVLAALANACPLCQGTGFLTVDQRQHWNSFAAAHGISECAHCHAVHLTCQASTAPAAHDHAPDPDQV